MMNNGAQMLRRYCKASWVETRPKWVHGSLRIRPTLEDPPWGTAASFEVNTHLQRVQV